MNYEDADWRSYFGAVVNDSLIEINATTQKMSVIMFCVLIAAKVMGTA